MTAFFEEQQKQQAKNQLGWQTQLDSWLSESAERQAMWKAHQDREVTDSFSEQLSRLDIAPGKATRASSNAVIQLVHACLPYVQGGSADLSCSDSTGIKASNAVQPASYGEFNIKYGAREFGMATLAAGLSLHGMFVPLCGTFLMFSDYMRNSIRLAALMNIPVIYQFTHDSVFLGEDGPTHQPVEHVSMLRATPGVFTWRPCDGIETTFAWKHALKSEQNPHALVLSRQNLTPQVRDDLGNISKGGYVLGFFTDPEDKEGKLESVSPEKIFGGSKDQYESLATPENLVKESTRK